MAAAAAAFMCTPPALTNTTFDWSASTKNCSNHAVDDDFEHGAIGQNAADPYIYWNDTPDSQLPGPATPTALESWLSAVSTLNPAQLYADLGSVYTRHAPVAGVAVSATSTLTYPNVPGYGSVVNVYELSGRIGGNGRFYFTHGRTVPCQSGGPSQRITEQVSYDGATLFWGVEDTPRYSAWASSSSRRNLNKAALAPFAPGLQGWVQNPFLIPLVPGYSYTTTTLSTNPSIIQIDGCLSELTPASMRGSVRWIVTSGHPSQLELRMPDGQVHTRFTYSNYQPIDSGNWRPFGVVEERFVPGSIDPWMTNTTVISAPTVLTAEEVASIPRAQPARQRWYLRLE
jgi:hypothetical protein